MESPYHKMLDRMDLQNIIAHAQGFDLSPTDEREMQVREKEAYEGMLQQLLELVGEQRLEAALDAAMGYLSVREDIMLALGMKMGARLQLQLLCREDVDFFRPPE